MIKVSKQVSNVLTRLALTGAAFVTLNGCIQSNENNSVIGRASQVSEVDLGLPAGLGELYDGYSLTIKPLTAGANCSPTLQETRAVNAQSIKLQHKVMNGCSYLIALDLGKISGNQLQVRFTNRNNSAGGDVIDAARLVGGSLRVSIVVNKIDNGATIAVTPATSPVTAATNPISTATSPVVPPQASIVPAVVTSPGGNPTPTSTATGNAAAVEKIFLARCSECHHPGGAAGIDLSVYPFKSTYLTSQRDIGTAARAAIASGAMPPAPRDKVTAAELATIDAWLSQEK